MRIYNMARIAQLECIIFRKQNDAYEFLLLKRIPEKGGFWQPISGGLEEYDKTKLEGCYRELFEEIGADDKDVLNVYENVYMFSMYNVEIDGEVRDKLDEYVFGFEIDPEHEVTFDKNIYVEHEDYIWTDFDTAIEMLKWDNNKDAFRELRKILNF